jgi:hypothetical protein
MVSPSVTDEMMGGRAFLARNTTPLHLMSVIDVEKASTSLITGGKSTRQAIYDPILTQRYN